MAYSPPRTFVPMTLQDTLNKPQRTLHSSRIGSIAPGTATKGPRPSHARQHSTTLSSGTTLRERDENTAKERQDNVKKEAAAMCEMLGIREGNEAESKGVPTSPSKDQNGGVPDTGMPALANKSTSELEVVRLRATLADKEREMVSLRRENAKQSKANAEMLKKCQALEKEKTTTGKEGLGAKQLEELEKSFEEQERILGGYQKDAERSMITIQNLENKLRRLSEFLTKLYGPSWENEIALHLDRPGLSVQSHSFNSPALRAGKGRNSGVGLAGSLAGFNINSTPHRSEISSLVEEPMANTDSTSSSAMALPEPANLPQSIFSQGNLNAHLESVQVLLRGMERRLISRDMDLEATEQRARIQANLLSSQSEQLAEILDKNARLCASTV